MIKMVFLVLWSIGFFSPEVALGSTYSKLECGLRWTESANKPKAKNPYSSAYGYYQFLSFWDRWIKKETGLIRYKMTGWQQRNILFPVYYGKVLMPFVTKWGGRLDAAIVLHYVGQSEATKYLKTKKDKVPSKGNIRISKYIKRVKKHSRSKRCDK